MKKAIWLVLLFGMYMIGLVGCNVPATAVTLYELKIGLVGLWVARNKSLSKLHATPPTQTPALSNEYP